MRKVGGIVAIVGGVIGLSIAIDAVVHVYAFIDAQKNVEFTGMNNLELTRMNKVQISELDGAIVVTDAETGEEPPPEEVRIVVGRFVVAHVWYGLFFCVATLGLGMWAFLSKNWMPGAGIIVASIFGVVLGGLGILVPMVITGIGGVLALFPISDSAASQD